MGGGASEGGVQLQVVFRFRGSGFRCLKLRVLGVKERGIWGGSPPSVK